jgi:tRNA dimethylallyltransferase
MYRDVPIITNKHPIAERFGIPHHVMNHIDWDQEYFIHRFEKEANQAIEDIVSRGKIPIIVGGTHYYLNSLLFNNKTIRNGNNGDSDKNESLTPEQIKILDGPSDTVFEILKQKDPKIAEKFHPNDTRRIRRALEIVLLTNRKTSEHYADQKINTQSTLRFKTLPFWIYSEKSILDKRLDGRVDNMLKNGGIDEIQELYEYYSNSPVKPDCERGVWQVIGFKEFLPWLEGGCSDDKSLEAAILDMKTKTRQYAKRQIKWIKNTLAIDLAKESSFQNVNGGKLYVLEATDLEKWKENVYERGIKITELFLNNQNNVPQLPDTLKGLIPTDQYKSDGEDFKTSQWEHITCEICRNADSTPLVLVGSKQYDIHLKSNRHRSNLQRGKRKREYEEWLAKKVGH